MSRFASKDACPKGAGASDDLLKTFQSKHVLFYIERTQNSNAVVYEANVKGGKLDADEPVKVYWIMYNNKPVNEEGLNMIERNTAYGMSTKPIAGKPGHFNLDVAPLGKLNRKLEVWMDDDGTLHCETVIDGVSAELKSVFVATKSNFVGMPKVVHVELKGSKTADGTNAYEKAIPE